jgi:hypothetical protein
MTDKLQQTIKEEVAKLPKDNQEVINNFGWEKITEEIGKKYLLSDNEINNFQVETLLILIGLEDLELYANNVENEVGTSKNEANKISEEVLKKIFTPISDILIENIKKSGKSKNPSWDKNLDFILSNGDYSAFMEKRAIVTSEETTTINKIPARPTTPPAIPLVPPPTLTDIKAYTEKTNIPVKPNKMEDIKKAN